jgi:hypothetical protein
MMSYFGLRNEANQHKEKTHSRLRLCTFAQNASAMLALVLVLVMVAVVVAVVLLSALLLRVRVLALALPAMPVPLLLATWRSSPSCACMCPCSNIIQPRGKRLALRGYSSSLRSRISRSFVLFLLAKLRCMPL